MREKVIKIIVSIISIILIIYGYMFFDTNSLMKQVRDAFLWKIDCSETMDKPIDAYNYNRYAINEAKGKVNLTLFRIFTLHNFHDGYIWAYYSYEAYNETGDLLTGSKSILTKWKIHKKNGQWEIVEIFEAP